jgi:hypothetical protein
MYSSVYDNSSFSFLSGANSVNANLYWDDPEFSIPIGFTFRLFADTTDTLYISGAIGKGGILTSKPVLASTTKTAGIVASGSDLVDRSASLGTSVSPISSITSGTAPNRILKIEWKNAGFYNAIDQGNLDDVTNFQVWIYEGSDIVEVRYGAGNYVSSALDLYDGGPGAWVGVFDSASSNGSARTHYYLTGNTNAPLLDSISTISSLSVPPGMNGHPASGSIYRFTPAAGNPLSYQYQIEQSHSNMRYVQANSQLIIDLFFGEMGYSVFDMSGRMLCTGVLQNGQNKIDMSNLPQGMYVVKTSYVHNYQSFKFIR